MKTQMHTWMSEHGSLGPSQYATGDFNAACRHDAALAHDLIRRLEVIRKWYEDNDPKAEEHWIAAGGSTCAKDCPLCKVEEALGISE
jgi:hypothetical protein